MAGENEKVRATGEARAPHAPIVAVTGATGLIGRRLLSELHSSTAWRVRTLARSADPRLPEQVQGDLRNPASLDTLVRGVDAVAHLAGMAHTTLRSDAEVEAAYATNVEGTRALLAAAQAAGVARFVLLSSGHVYAGQRGVDLDESSATSGDATYAGMKLLAEEAASSVAGMSIAVLRPCLTYGPGVRHNLSALLRALRRGYYVQVRGGVTLRSLASVDTVAAAVLHLLGRPQHTGCYNVADREPVQLEEWTRHLARLMHARPPHELPLGVLRALAAAGSAARRVGLPSPLTTGSLTKLTEPFSLNVGKLAATGFTWPETRDAVLQQMIDAEFGATPRTGATGVA